MKRLVIGNFLASATSTCPNFGPRARLRPAFPQVPLAGTLNASGLIQLLMVWFAGTMETPLTVFGRVTVAPALLVVVVRPSGTEEAARTSVTSTGLPERAYAVPASCQPPKKKFASPPRVA